MKGIRKLSITALLAVSMLTVGTTSAFAGWNWGDTMDSAVSLYYPGGGSSSSAYVPIDSYNDNDWYVVNNVGGSGFGYTMIMTPPSGINYDVQIVTTDANDNILNTRTLNYNGPGYAEATSAYVYANQKVYFRVMSAGYNDYDSTRGYSLDFKVTN